MESDTGARRVTRCAECPSPCASPRRRAEPRRRCTPPSWFLSARMGALLPASRYTSPSTGARAACRCRPGRGRGTGCAWWSRRPTRTGALRRGARPRLCLHPVLPTPRLIVREPALLTGAACCAASTRATGWPSTRQAPTPPIGARGRRSASRRASSATPASYSGRARSTVESSRPARPTRASDGWPVSTLRARALHRPPPPPAQPPFRRLLIALLVPGALSRLHHLGRQCWPVWLAALLLLSLRPHPFVRLTLRCCYQSERLRPRPLPRRKSRYLLPLTPLTPFIKWPSNTFC